MLTRVRAVYADTGVAGVCARAAETVRLTVGAPFATLQTIGYWCHTDKVKPLPVNPNLSYLKIYDSLFRQWRRRPVHLLEIGALYGNSLDMWASYFPNGRIFGLDIDPNTARHERGRIRMTIGSQADPAVLTEAVSKAGQFDIVIDDGSHVVHHQIASFKYLFPYLKPGGYYVIEDLGCSYHPLDDNGVRQLWPGMAYNAPDDNLNNDRGELEAFFTQRIRDMDHDRDAIPGAGKVASVQFWPFLCVIQKANRS